MTSPTAPRRAVGLLHGFGLARPPEEVWPIVADPGWLARCLPGAVTVEGEALRGTVEVGPTGCTYEGAVRIVEREAPHRLVVEVTGRRTDGRGDATATVELRLQTRGAGTWLHLATDLELDGPVAGQGVVADLWSRFVARLAAGVEEQLPVPPTGARPPAEPALTTPDGTGRPWRRLAVTGGAVAGAVVAAALCGRRLRPLVDARGRIAPAHVEENR